MWKRLRGAWVPAPAGFLAYYLADNLPGIPAGASLSFARSLGEFGSIVFISGNLPFETEVTSLLVFIRLDEYDYPAAAALAFMMLLMAFLCFL